MHDVSSFVTLTYDQKNYSPSLDYLDYQRFMYRLRDRFGPTRFFVCGEYGEQTQRPHFHAILFGKTFRSNGQIGKNVYRSEELERLWKNGISSFGECTYESAAYVAGYTLKKITGPPADSHYSRVDLRTGECLRVEPEFGHMSLKPGIGYTWFQKYWKEVYLARDGVVRKGGAVCPPPKYYDKLLLEMDSDLKESIDFKRYISSEKFRADCTIDRLKVREDCALAKRKFLKKESVL